jgi:hypothetical protein
VQIGAASAPIAAVRWRGPTTSPPKESDVVARAGHFLPPATQILTRNMNASPPPAVSRYATHTGPRQGSQLRGVQAPPRQPAYALP